MVSTRDLSQLPDVHRLKLAFQSMALLDAIFCAEWQFRYYSFELNSDPDGVISFGSMRNGSGDDLHAIFGRAGCLIRGFAHEYEMSPYSHDPPKVFPGILEDVPTDFVDFIGAMHADWWRDITFCVWRLFSDAQWQHGRIEFPNLPDPDGSEFLLSPYDGRPETYQAWAEDYFGANTDTQVPVRMVFEHRPLTEEIVHALNPQRSLAELGDEIRQIGYGSDDS